MSSIAMNLTNFDNFFSKEKLGSQFIKLKEKFLYVANKCPQVRKVLDNAVKYGYFFGGEPKSESSKANTDTKNKVIRVTDACVSGEKTVEEKLNRQVLSLAYEFTNADNGEELNKIFQGITSGKVATAEKFVDGILEIEARAQLTKMAACRVISQEIPEVRKLVNPIYFKVFEQGSKTLKEKGEIITDLKQAMIDHGILSRSGIKITKHYEQMFYRLKPSDVLQEPVNTEIDGNFTSLKNTKSKECRGSPVSVFEVME